MASKAIEVLPRVKMEVDTVFTDRFFDNVRKRLKLTKKQLSDSIIKKTVKLSNKLIGEWVVDNVDGYHIKDNGVIATSKFMPKALRQNKEEDLNKILNGDYPEFFKKIFAKRYDQALATPKHWVHDKPKIYSNLHSFFNIYKVLWFNADNCQFDKAKLYELNVDRKIRNRLNKRIMEGKDYVAYDFTDFRSSKRKRRLEKQLQEARKKKLKLAQKKHKEELEQEDYL